MVTGIEIGILALAGLTFLTSVANGIGTWASTITRSTCCGGEIERTSTEHRVEQINIEKYLDGLKDERREETKDTEEV